MVAAPNHDGILDVDNNSGSANSLLNQSRFARSNCTLDKFSDDELRAELQQRRIRRLSSDEQSLRHSTRITTPLAISFPTRLLQASTRCPNPPSTLLSNIMRTTLNFSNGYSARDACGWLIQCPRADDLVLLNFTQFGTEFGHDYVSLFDGPTVNSPPITDPQLSGPTLTALPQTTYAGKNGVVLLIFNANSQVNALGFALDYWCGEPAAHMRNNATIGCTDILALNYVATPNFVSSCVFPAPQSCIEYANVYNSFMVGSSEPDVTAWAQLRGWNNNSDPCNADAKGGWEGVSCIAGRVTSLNFHAYSHASALGYTLDGSVARLSQLRILDLYGSGLSGTIPMQLGKAVQLHTLKLCHTALSGTIPTMLGTLTQLQALWLQDSALSGTLPNTIRNLTHVMSMLFYDTMLSGTLPKEIGHLTLLQYLGSYDIGMSGTLPREIGHLTQLQRLYAHDTEISGTLPHTIGQLKQLQRLYLYDVTPDAKRTSLSGTLPHEIGQLEHLQRLVGLQWQYLLIKYTIDMVVY
eukprot:COSAG01_NODE_10242_length_2211_cov_5.478693_1_plen_523_part_01